MRLRTRSLKRFLTCALVLCLVAVLVGCSASDPQNTLAPSGPVATKQANLFWIVIAIAAAVFVFVEFLVVFVAWKFRARRAGEIPHQTHGNTRLEVGWTIAPVVVLAVLAIPTFTTLWDLSKQPEPSDNALQVRVIARQWWWEFQYPELTNPNDSNRPLVIANELHIPVNRKVEFTLESADIIHSFWVPKLAGKQDVVPNQTNHLWLEASSEGEYYGQCMEFCGLSHANMRFRVVALSADGFDNWVKEQQRPASNPTDAAAVRGAALFQNNPVQACASCHTISGTQASGSIAPNLTHFASRGTFGGASFARNDENLHKWLTDPPAMKPGARMPVFGTGLSSQQIDDLVAYLQTLK